MPEDTSISIQLNAQVKEQAENILSRLGLTMAAVVNMLLCQIVRERAVPLSLSLAPPAGNTDVVSQLRQAKADRAAGYAGRSYDSILEEMEQIVVEAQRREACVS
jgi:addiction module RelB/DinJ family antitoxin